MDSNTKRAFATAFLLMIGGIGIGVWLPELTGVGKGELPEPATVEPLAALSPQEQHAVDVLISAFHDQPDVERLLPWAKRLVSGETILLVPTQAATGIESFFICTTDSTINGSCGGCYCGIARSRLGNLLKSGTVLSLTFNAETAEIYVNDRIGYSILPKE